MIPEGAPADQSRGPVRSILLALDASPEAQAAVEVTLRWVDRLGASVVGLGVVDEPGIRAGEPVPPGAGDYSERDRVNALLRALAERCREQRVTCELQKASGSPHERIVIAAQEHDLVVIPRSGRFKYDSGRHRDDTVARVLRESSRPVVTVPSGPVHSGPVVVAYDGGTHAARALHEFIQAGLEPSADVLVVTVHESEAAAAQSVEHALEYLTSHGVAGRFRIVTTLDPANEPILRVVREVDARLLVAGVRTSHPLAERLFGSITHALVRDSDTPMFLST